MFKKFAFSLFLCIFTISIVSAQSTNKQWEYLEVSEINSSYNYPNIESFPYRTYNFFNEGKVISGTASLDWLGKSGWELVGAISTGENNSSTKLVFKRPYNQQRTKNEIEQLSKTFAVQTKIPTADLIDLDAQATKQKLDDFNRREEERLKVALASINNLPVKVISVKSMASSPDRTGLAAEIVIDGTSILLKDGNKYRSSEAVNYLQEVNKRIIDSLKLEASLFSQIHSNFPIGKFPENPNGGISIGISVIINYKEKQNVVAQGYVSGRWKETKP